MSFFSISQDNERIINLTERTGFLDSNIHLKTTKIQYYRPYGNQKILNEFKPLTLG